MSKKMTGFRRFAKWAGAVVLVLGIFALTMNSYLQTPRDGNAPTRIRSITINTYQSCAARGSRFCVITTAKLTEEWSQVYAIPPWYGPDFRLPEGATVEVRANRSNNQVFRQDWYGMVYLEKDGKFLPMDPETNPWRGAGASYIEIRAANAASVGKEFTAVISAMDRE